MAKNLRFGTLRLEAIHLSPSIPWGQNVKKNGPARVGIPPAIDRGGCFFHAGWPSRADGLPYLNLSDGAARLRPSSVLNSARPLTWRFYGTLFCHAIQVRQSIKCRVERVPKSILNAGSELRSLTDHATACAKREPNLSFFC